MRKIIKRKEGKKSFKFQVSGLAALNSAAPRVKFQVSGFEKQNALYSRDGNGILL